MTVAARIRDRRVQVALLVNPHQRTGYTDDRLLLCLGKGRG